MPLSPFAVHRDDAPAYWSLGELLVLTLRVPGGVEQLFVDLGEPATARTLPADDGEPDLERVLTLAGHYGAEVLSDWP